MADGTALCVGTTILDVLGRPIEAIPDVARATIIEQIRLTAAGTAAGTAVDLARLGVPSRLAGAVGDDEIGAFLRSLLASAGVDTAAVVTKARAQTAATILGIPPDGTRPAWHVVGANALLGPDDLPENLLDGCTSLHYGGITALPGLDGGPSARLLAQARERGLHTTADCLGVKRSDAHDLLGQLLPHVDVFLPNDHEAMAVTGTATPLAAAEALLALGAGAVVVTAGSHGAAVATPGRTFLRPAYDVPVVDSTGCGDAVCAGVICGLRRGWDLLDAVDLGLAAAALTLQGLGSDAGIRSFDQAGEVMRQAPRLG